MKPGYFWARYIAGKERDGFTGDWEPVEVAHDRVYSLGSEDSARMRDYEFGPEIPQPEGLPQ